VPAAEGRLGVARATVRGQRWQALGTGFAWLARTFGRTSSPHGLYSCLRRRSRPAGQVRSTGLDGFDVAQRPRPAAATSAFEGRHRARHARSMPKALRRHIAASAALRHEEATPGAPLPPLRRPGATRTKPIGVDQCMACRVAVSWHRVLAAFGCTTLPLWHGAPTVARQADSHVVLSAFLRPKTSGPRPMAVHRTAASQRVMQTPSNPYPQTPCSTPVWQQTSRQARRSSLPAAAGGPAAIRRTILTPVNSHVGIRLASCTLEAPHRAEPDRPGHVRTQKATAATQQAAVRAQAHPHRHVHAQFRLLRPPIPTWESPAVFHSGAPAPASSIQHGHRPRSSIWHRRQPNSNNP
jgi:hypothetical protein